VAVWSDALLQFILKDVDLSQRQCSIVSCFQWILNKQGLLSLQRRDGRPVLVLVSAALSAIPIPKPIPLVSARYRYRVLVSV